MNSLGGHLGDEAELFSQEWKGPDTTAPHIAKSDRSTTVCIHGLAESHRSWSEVAPELSKRGRVVALDLPGFGDSPRQGRRSGLDAAQHALDRFIVSKLDPPVVLIGSSMGGAVAALQASRRPETVRGLVLSSSYLPPVLEGARAPLVASALILERLGDLGFGIRRRELADLRPDPEVIPEQHRPSVPHLLSGTEMVISMVALSARPKYASDIFAVIRCPVLLLHGEVDSHVPVAWAYAAQQRCPGWRIEVLPSAAHGVHRIDPRWWLGRVGEWLDSIE